MRPFLVEPLRHALMMNPCAFQKFMPSMSDAHHSEMWCAFSFEACCSNTINNLVAAVSLRPSWRVHSAKIFRVYKSISDAKKAIKSLFSCAIKRPPR